MPILAHEPSLYPADLFQRPALEQCDRRWWALHTKPRQEKCLARYLHQAGTPFYLPLVPKRRVQNGRKLESHIPLFTSYVFLLGTEEQRLDCLSTNRVTQVIEVIEQGQLLTDLAQIQRLIEANAPLTLEQRIEAGQRVRVKSGSLMGLEGMVLARRKESRLLVAVQFLQQGVSVEVDDFTLEPLD